MTTRRPWSDLTHAGRVRRLRTVARAALARFGVEGRITLLHHGENTAYRVDGAERWMLRVCRVGYHSGAALRSESVWLRALRAAGMQVPDPVDGPDGPVVTVSVPGVPGSRRCVLFRWVPGSIAGAGLTVRGFQAVGHATARLHEVADALALGPDFERPRGDWAGLLGPEAAWGDPLAEPTLTGEARALVARTVERLREELEGLPTEAPGFGLIHADLHPWNVLFQGDVACPIDFDDTLVGHRAFEAMVTLWGWMDEPDFPEREAAWLAGYREVRPLSDAEFAPWRRWVVVGRIRRLGWVRTRSDVPRIAATMPDAIRGAVEACEAYWAEVERGER